MMKKKLSVILTLAILLVTCLAAACSVATQSGEKAKKNVKLLVSELSLYIGDEYRLRTDDGVDYETFESENTAVCTVTANGIVSAKAEGSTTVGVTVEGERLSCAVTVAKKEGVDYGDEGGGETKDPVPLTFLGVEMTADNLLARAPDFYERMNVYANVFLCNLLARAPDFYDRVSGSLVFTNSYLGGEIEREDGGDFAVFKCSGSYACVWYDLLLPEEEPDCAFYEWELYTSKAMTLQWIGGRTNVELEAGWNSVQFTWEQLSGRESLFTGVGRFEVGEATFAIGSLTGKSWEDIESSVKFLDAAVTADNLRVENGEAVYVTDGEMVDTESGDIKGIALTASSARPKIYYDNFIPAEANYDYAIWRLYNGTGANLSVKIGSKTVTLGKGWNSVKIDWENLVSGGAEAQYISFLADISTEEPVFAVGSLSAYKNPEGDENSVRFLGTVMTADTLQIGRPEGVDPVSGLLIFTDNYNNGQIVREDGRQFAVTQSAGTYICVWYTKLLPDSDPGCAFYEWEIYAETDMTVANIGGKNNVALKAGWNTVQLSWAELSGKTYIFTGTGKFQPNDRKFAIGSLTGKSWEDIESSVKFLDAAVTADNLRVENGEAVYVTDGDMLDTDNGDIKGIALNASSARPKIYYDNFIPAEANYDYAIWRLYNGTGANLSVKIGSKTVTLGKGWNSVKIDWTNLVSGGAEAQYISFLADISTEEPVFAVGSLSAYKNPEGDENSVRFLGAVMSTETLQSGTPDGGPFSNYSAYMNITDNYNNGQIEHEGKQFAAVRSSGSYICIWYTNLLPDSDPGYDYYAWEIYSEEAITVSNIGGKTNVELQAGWNTVYLTWAELSGKANIFTGTGKYSDAQWKLAIGSLTGCEGEIPSEPDPNALTFLEKEVTKETLQSGTPDGGPFSNYSAYMNITDNYNNGQIEHDGKQFAAVRSSGSYICIWYTNLLPDSDPGYDYYAWEIYSEAAITVSNIGGKTNVELSAGWNTVYLTWAELSGKTNIFTGTGKYSDAEWKLAIGSLTGCEGEIPSEPDPNALTFLGQEVTKVTLQSGAPDSGAFTNYSAYMNITDNYNNGQIEHDGKQFAAVRSSGSYICVWYTKLLPDSDPGYDYYAWEIYSEAAITVSNIGGKTNVELSAGWNTVYLTWEELSARGYIFTGTGKYSDAEWKFAISSLTGCEGEMPSEPDPNALTFLGKEVTKETLQSGTPDGGPFSNYSAYMNITDNYNNGQIEHDGKQFAAVRSSGSYICIWYTNLLPDSDPGYDYYAWEIYSEAAITVSNIGGKTNVELSAGWNTVYLTWAELSGKTNIFTGTGKYSDAEWKLAIGSLTGCEGEIPSEPDPNALTFLGQEVTKETLQSGAPDSGPFTNYEPYMNITDNYNNGQIEHDGKQFAAVRSSGSYICVWYTNLLPDSDPGYDYYAWEIYSEEAITVSNIGGKTNVELQAGWNTVYLTWAELSGKTNIFTGTGKYSDAEWKLAIGSLTGCEGEMPSEPDPNALTFLGKEVTKETLQSGAPDGGPFSNYSLYMNITDNYNNGQIEHDGKQFAAVRSSGSYICVWYTNLLPDSDPGYDYYAWEIYSEAAITVSNIGGKTNVELSAGWNTVYLTWAELSGKANIFTGTGKYSDAEWKLAIGSLTGCEGEIPSEPDPNALTFLGQEVTKETLQSGAPDGGSFANYSAYMNITDNYNNGQIEHAGKTFAAVRSSGSYICVWYTKLLPDSDPGYDYYAWEIYSEEAITISNIGGKTNVELSAGWNTVYLTWAELSGKTNIFTGTGKYSDAQWKLAIGSLTGCYNR